MSPAVIESRGADSAPLGSPGLLRGNSPSERGSSWRTLAVVSAALVLAACASPPPGAAPSQAAAAVPPMPEAASGFTARAGWHARRQAVAAANPLASDAGIAILRAGGSAIDAAIAVQMVLGLVEPQSSGIGGGAFLMHWDGRRVQAFDGRETAPAAADERLFLGADGKPMPFQQAVFGGRSVGVPGALAMLQAAHRQHGRLPWAQLFEPALRLAEQGFEVSPRLHTLLQSDAHLRRDAAAKNFFYSADGQPHPVGHKLRNPALAAVMRAVAKDGSPAFYRGAIAQDLVERVRTHPQTPGRMSVDDLSRYQPREREPLCTDWGARWRVCGMPPPSSGHLTVMQILGMLEHRPAQPLVAGLPDADWLHDYLEASRLAYADRAQFIADPDFAAAPGGDWRSLLAPAYLQQRAALIGARSLGVATPGSPAPQRVSWGHSAEQPASGTSHISIVDARGNAVSLTTTIEAAFGSRILADGGTGLAGGYLLNNQLTDFSLAPADAQGRPKANRVEPGKRPRSSMSPTLVFDRNDGRLAMTLGSPGGAAIIHFTAKTLIGTLQWGLSPQDAIALPNFANFNGPSLLEKGRFDARTVEALKARGHTVNEVDLTSGIQALQRDARGWRGGADPRREGVVAVD